MHTSADPTRGVISPIVALCRVLCTQRSDFGNLIVTYDKFVTKVQIKTTLTESEPKNQRKWPVYAHFMCLSGLKVRFQQRCLRGGEMGKQRCNGNEFGNCCAVCGGGCDFATTLPQAFSKGVVFVSLMVA